LRITLAQVALVAGRPSEAIDILGKPPDLVAIPLAHALRGQARVAADDLPGARGDFEAALKKLPNLEPALIGSAWLDIAEGNAAAARQSIEPRYKAGASSALVTVYAAALRRAGDAASRDKAKQLLNQIIDGAPGPDVGRAELELGRLLRDSGDVAAARPYYTKASAAGSFEARLENGLVYIDERDPPGGRETLDALLKEQGEHPPGNLVLEAARARMLVGDHEGAEELLARAEKLTVPANKLARERGRLRLRKGDIAGATKELSRALDARGDDAETFLLAADVVSADDKSPLADKLRKSLKNLKNRPEVDVVNAKLALAAGKLDEAEKLYRAAKEALKQDHASPRRMAQADFGFAVIAAINRERHPDDMEQRRLLGLAINEDPSLYDAYLYYADLLKTRDKKKALEQARLAVKYNPDYAIGWLIVGQRAVDVGDRATLAEAANRLAKIAPGSEELKQIQQLR
jgi:tetratricopeptide (TPR) repeat protein